MDCLSGHNIDFLISGQPEIDCNRRCINNYKCGGYTRVHNAEYPNRCYFKSWSCRGAAIHVDDVILVLLQGNKFE